MDLVLEAVKNDLDSVIQTGRYLLAAFFVLAVFVNYLGVLESKANWPGLFLRLVIGFVLLQNYTWVMDTTKDIVIGIDLRINPDQSYINQYAAMNDNMQSSFEANTQTNFVSKVTGFFGQFTLHNLIVNLSFIFYAVISKIMESIRYSFLGIMYKLGPVLIPLILFHSTVSVLKGWYTSYVSILAWPILWHIALSVAVALSAQIGTSGQGIEQFACLNFAVCFILIFTPIIISHLVSGVGMGTSPSLAGAVVTGMLMRYAPVVRNAAVQTAGIVKGSYRVFQNPRTPTTSGKFKAAMTGAGSTPSASIKKTTDNKGKNA